MLRDGEQPVEKFDGSDFRFWKMQIEDYLYGSVLYLPIDGKKPEGMKDGVWKLLYIKEMLDQLSALYEKPTAVNKIHLMQELFNLRMAEGVVVPKHQCEFNMTIAQLGSIDIKFKDEVLARILLSSLLESWSGTVTTVRAIARKKNLLLVGQRDEDGFDVIFSCRNCKIAKGARVIAQGKKEGTLSKEKVSQGSKTLKKKKKRLKLCIASTGLKT
ncbi:hypothetical protein QQ045_000198 [Rhodiola kirilowii]